MAKKAQAKRVSKRKYLNYCLLMIAIILGAFIIYKAVNTYRDNKLGDSVFTRLVGNIQYTDIENAVSELPTEGFILISYTKDQKVKDLESDLKKSIVAKELQSSFYYLDATELKLEDDYIEILNDKFKTDEKNEIVMIPAILYYKDNVLMKTISSTEDRMLSVDDFDKMLDEYEVLSD